MLKIIKSNYFILFVLALVLMSASLVFVLDAENMNTTYYRTARTLELSRYSETVISTDNMVRILTSPAVVYLPIYMSRVFADFNFNLILLNIIFYFVSIFYFFKLVKLVYKSEKVALIASVLFFTNYIIVYSGLMAQAEMSGFAFLILSTYFAVKYFYQPGKTKYFLLAILFSAIGVLFKEYAVLGMLTLGMLILFSRAELGSQAKLVSKLMKILWSGILFLIIPGIYYLVYFLSHEYNYLSWYQNAASLDNYGFILLIKVLGSLYLFGWFYFLLGLYQEYKSYNKERATVLLAMVPASLSFLGWPCLLQRVAFVAVPLLAMISGFGLSKIRSNTAIILLLLLYAVTQFFMKDILVIVNI